MKSKIRKTIKLFFFILITNIQFSQAHNSLNGGCKAHCEESLIPIIIENNLKNISDKNQIENNDSCLSKSLCRG